MLKSHITIAKRNIINRAVSRFEYVEWEPNAPAEAVGYGMTAQPFDDASFSKLFTAAFPLIESWMFSLQSRQQFDDAGAIAQVLLKMEKYGVLGNNQLLQLHHLVTLAEDRTYRSKLVRAPPTDTGGP